MISSLLRKWYGDFSRDELRKYIILGLIFSIIIGTYWTIRTIKDGIFGAMIIGPGGGEKEWLQAMAKVVSLIVLFPIIAGYGKLVDKVKKHQLFYIMGAIYVVLMLLFAYLLGHAELGLPNKVASPTRILGWAQYVFVESFGSLMVALFWAYVTDTSTAASAKRGFALIVMIGQIGGIVMPGLLKSLPRTLGTTSAPLFAVCAGFVALVILLFAFFIKTTPKEQLEGYKAASTTKQNEGHEEPGFLEGLKLLLSHKYLIGIFAILCFMELVITIIDFNFKVMVNTHFAYNDVLANEYFGSYGSWVNTVSFICLVLGINNVQRKLGLTTALCLVPLLFAGAVAAFYGSPSFQVLFWIMVGAKAVNYALNGPSIKQLYVPTTEDVKYKSQAWIETFGSRSSKAGASFINMTKSALGFGMYLAFTTGFSVLVIIAWFFCALYLARTCNKAVEQNTVVC